MVCAGLADGRTGMPNPIRDARRPRGRCDFRGFWLDGVQERSVSNSVGAATSSRFLVAFYAVLFVVACIPIFCFSVLPLGDTVNHATRAYILNNLAAEPDLQKYYAIHWDLFSFQSTDLLLPPLARWLGLDIAARLFVVVTFALLIAGTTAVHRMLFGWVGVWPAAVFLFLYNFALVSGQISYLFSTGCSLLLFAAWIATERWPRAIRLPLFAAASFGLMLCHFFAFAAYGLLVMGFALGQALRARTLGEKLRLLLEAGMPFIPSAIGFLLSFGNTISGPTSWGEILNKTIALLIGTLNYGYWPDHVLALAVIIPLFWLNRRRRVSLAPAMRIPVLVLVLTAIAMPSMLFGVFAADFRLPCLLYFLLVAASEVRLEGRRQVAGFATGVFALLVLRVATTTVLWSHFDADYRAFRAADSVLDRGSRVAVIPAGEDFRTDPLPQHPYWFITCLAVIDRQVLMPNIYTAATPLQLTQAGKDLYSDTLARSRTVHWQPLGPAFAKVDPETVRQADVVGQRISKDDIFTSTIDWSDWPERFDYLIDLHMGRSANPVPALLTEITRGSYFTIYRIHPPQQL
jgi:hypothetical protein